MEYETIPQQQQQPSNELLDYSYLYSEAIRKRSVIEYIKGIKDITFKDICLGTFDFIEGFVKGLPRIIIIPC
jgi:hypothetical protein